MDTQTTQQIINENVDVTVTEETKLATRTTEEVAHELISEALKTNKKTILAIFCSSVGAIACCSLIFTITIPVIVLIIGTTFRYDCPIQPRIPFYLIVQGSFLTVTGTLGVILQVVSLLLLTKGRGAAVKKIARVRGIIVILSSVIFLIWVGFGCYWTFSIKNKVQYDPYISTNNMNTNAQNKNDLYCDKTLYIFTFVLLILTIICASILGCSTCCAEMLKLCT
ncbi:unnamed protein product [Didymodactylos carnosus]|uniref:Uncharacterized protein n=1 Tax=Didymodactylos carnosus TaxID=1234261 RepID=A0A814MEI2_9BILA|nr:unnamed protein product [Didymodactylos carnosus]CAF1078584.1 unnamed protein product [Didymodactylos carnosus]CAF3760493.1 unnamed protein product [Didymodactylos carnosus]CAF3844768.1 unnamed protein product [Didymodactylos carnosus]